MYKIAFVLFTFFIVSSCDDKKINSSSIDESFAKELKDQQLGESGYSISIPANYSIKETDGPDFLVYYFYPTDTMSESHFFGGLYFGNHPNKTEIKNDTCITETIKNTIIGNNTAWALYNCNESYFIQTIIENPQQEGWNTFIHIFGKANSKTDLLKLQTIYSTLKSKKTP